jgi:hypothetical protein
MVPDPYHFASELAGVEEPPPDQTKTTASYDQATIDEQNDHDFLTFEAAIPSLSRAFNLLDEAEQGQVFENQQALGEDLDTGPLARIEADLAYQLKRFGSQVRSLHLMTNIY